MNEEKILDELINKLEEEKRLIIAALKDKSKIDSLFKVIEEKKFILNKISNMNKSAIKSHKSKLELIKQLSEENMLLAYNNIQFIEDIFEAIFKEDTKTYGDRGNFPKETKSLINKKI